MENVHIVSGTEARYLTWGTTAQSKTTTAVSVAGNATTGPLAIYKESPLSTFQAMVAGTGAVSATVVIMGSNEDATGQGTNQNWVTLGTITLSGTTSATDGFATNAPWRFVSAWVTAISGTGATVQVLMGV